MESDFIQIIYRIEDELEILIPDNVIEKLISPRAVFDFLMNQPKISENFSRDYIEITVWRIIEEETGIGPRDFDDDARFTEDMDLDN